LNCIEIEDEIEFEQRRTLDFPY